MKHIFIINPESGNGKHHRVVTWIETYFHEHPDAYTIHYTEYIQHAEAIAKMYQGDYRLYSVGGDGTAHEVLNGIQEGVEMAIIPTGSGNDFWRMMDCKQPLEKILVESVEGETSLIDVGLANGRKFLNCMNVGLDAAVNVRVNRIRNPFMPRKLVYVYAAIREIIKGDKIPIRYECEGQTVHETVVLTSVMNGKWYGGGFKSAPSADLQDGYLNLCMVQFIPRRKIIPLLPIYFQGKHESQDVVKTQKVTKIRFEFDAMTDYGCDGEVYQASEIEVMVLPKTLRLVIPR